jgi:hypothetical protein
MEERRYWNSDSALIIEVQLAFQLIDSREGDAGS